MRGRLLLILRLVLAAVFLYAAYTKLREPWMLFAMAIDAYQLLPEWASMLLGRTLPWIELTLGIWLAAGIALRYAAAGATLLLGVFFGIMIRTYAMGLKIDCACFGLGDPISGRTLLRDGVLLGLAGVLTLLAIRTGQPGSLVPSYKPKT